MVTSHFYRFDARSTVQIYSAHVSSIISHKGEHLDVERFFMERSHRCFSVTITEPSGLYLSSFSGYIIAQGSVCCKMGNCIKWPVSTWATGRTCADSRKVIDKTGVHLISYICSAVIGPLFFVPRFPHGCGNKKSVPAGHTKTLIEFRYRRAKK